MIAILITIRMFYKVRGTFGYVKVDKKFVIAALTMHEALNCTSSKDRANIYPVARFEFDQECEKILRDDLKGVKPPKSVMCSNIL